MRLKEFGIILTPTFRAHAYLQKLTQNDFYPNFAIIINGKNKDSLKNVSKENSHYFFSDFQDFKSTLNRHKIPYVEFHADSCNDKKIIKIIKNRDEKYFIYTGGGILKEEILNLGKKFIHIHPGIVPKYRGSTCIYYSIINEDKCGATAFFMSKKIDSGDVISKKIFKKPSIVNIDYEYDCHIRSDLLIDTIKKYIINGKFHTKPQNYRKGETYFIIHPVLKHLAILSCIKNEKSKNIP